MMPVSFDAIAATLVTRSKPLQASALSTKLAQKSDGEGFASLLTKVADTTVTNIQSAEAMSIKGIEGKANTYEVATSVMQAEQSLRMAIGVRDKMVSAYLEISRMQI